MKIKICGLAQVENANQIAALQPDFVGCIFTPKSKRYISISKAKLINHPQKIGVFVNQPLSEIANAVTQCALYGVQLHGNESPDFCTTVKNQFPQVQIIKVISVQTLSDFDCLKDYENNVDYFLFDTKGNQAGGNGTPFNWELLNLININKPYFLAGGVSAETLKNIEKLKIKPFAIDANSKLEDGIGIKNSIQTKKIIQHVQSI